MDLNEALRLVHIGVTKYHTKTPIILGGQVYMVIGEVQDLADSYVCLRLDERDMATQVMLLTLPANTTTYDLRDIDPDEQLVTGSERQSVDCTTVSSMVAALFSKVQGQVAPTMEARIPALQLFARRVLLELWAAGIFTGKHAHEETIAFGAHYKLPPPKRRTETDRRLAELRRGCVPDSKFGIMAYAEKLIALKAWEFLYEEA
jgi:hypothetical protein